jgi:predicted transglutaminase-like cysteine proteinase
LQYSVSNPSVIQTTVIKTTILRSVAATPAATRTAGANLSTRSFVVPARAVLRRALLALAVVVAAALSAPPAEAKYTALAKAPQSQAGVERQRHYGERLTAEAAHYTAHPSKRVRYWRTALRALAADSGIGAAARAATLPTTLARIYRLSNRLVSYRAEEGDVWQTPGETLGHGHGDCEDFAILYYHGARLAGVDPARLWLVFGYSYRRHGREGHAVALIEGTDGRQYILDSLLRRVIPAARHSNFLPVYAVNGARPGANFMVNTSFLSAARVRQAKGKIRTLAARTRDHNR